MERAPEERERPIELSGRVVAVVATLTGLGLALVAILLRPAAVVPPVVFTAQAHAAAERLAHSPTDRSSLETLARLSLDLEGDRRGLWRDSAAAAQRLAPAVDSPRLAFVKAGLLHWYELDEEDREEVAAIAAGLLGDEAHYRSLWQPILQTMRDPAFLAEHSPGDPAIRRQLRDTAALWGDHATYRALERELPLEWRTTRKLEPVNDARSVSIPPTRAWELGGSAARTLVIEASGGGRFEPPLMVEVRIDGSLREARAVSSAETWTVRIRPGDEVIEVHVANPRTTSGTARQIAVTVTPEG